MSHAASLEEFEKIPIWRRMKDYVHVNADGPSHTSTYDSSTTFRPSGASNTRTVQQFARDFKISIAKLDKQEMVFDMVGIETPIANAFRRILLEEIPTMAIERVIVKNNTSIMQDEVLAHRLGLIPIRADPRLFEYMKPGDEETDKNTLRFRLKIACKLNPNAAPDSKAPAKKYLNHEMLSGMMEWIPIGSQADEFAADPPAPVHSDVVLNKLRPGQEVDVELIAYKGIGRTHAKWSPVSTAFYRLMPHMVVSEQVTDELADALVAKCPMGVFDIEDIAGVKRAVPTRPRDCSMCRECIREPEWQRRVNLLRVKNHFIFSIESTGILPPEVILQEGIKVLQKKCTDFLEELDHIEQSNS
eukprot:TRINITY_DN17660_c0_g1_i1.p1 TRINITY_DN17660_c0_g1~~TRINITY_DN17660_c0_g1_i1.p1  ORF type:complete len:359 (-),score=74.93 TRINITY_DN17660_c0_g1_i1:48-1124(-)